MEALYTEPNELDLNKMRALVGHSSIWDNDKQEYRLQGGETLEEVEAIVEAYLTEQAVTDNEKAILKAIAEITVETPAGLHFKTSDMVEITTAITTASILDSEDANIRGNVVPVGDLKFALLSLTEEMTSVRDGLSI